MKVGSCFNGFRVQTSALVCSHCSMQNAIYQCFIYLCDVATEPHEEFLKKNFPVHHSLFSKLLDTHFVSIQDPFSHCRSVLFWDKSKTLGEWGFSYLIKVNWYSYYVLNDLFLHTVYRLPSYSTCSAVEITAAVTGTTALVIEVWAGFIAGDLVYHCVNNHWIRHRSQSCKPASCSHQQRQAGPVYEEVLQKSLNWERMWPMCRVLNWEQIKPIG